MLKGINKDVESTINAYKGNKPSTKVAIWIIIITLICAAWGASSQSHPNDGWDWFFDFIFTIDCFIIVPWIALKLFTKII